jgi:membrane protein DedA with SNARE-associated domain
MDWIQTFWTNLQAGQLPQLGIWSYLILSFLVLIEGPIATLLGAAAASAGLLRPSLVFIFAASGNLTADILWYSLGYLGKVEWLLHYGSRIGVRRSHLDGLQNEISKHAVKFLLIAKLTAGFVIPTLIAAGLAKIPWRRWFPVVLSGEMLWTGSLVLLGYYATEAIKQIEKGVQYLALAATALFIVIGFFGVRRILIKHEKLEESVEEEKNGERG